MRYLATILVNFKLLKAAAAVLFISGFSFQLDAQDVFNQTNVFIPDQLAVTSEGSWNNSGFLINNGSIRFTGDWSNTFVYQGLGAIILTGADQIISNNRQSFREFSVGGGGTKTINGLLTVDRVLALKDGVVSVSDNDTLRLWPEAEIEGGSSLSYVDGAMIHFGTGYKFFPIGKNNQYHPAILASVSGINPAIEMEVHEGFPPVETSLPVTTLREIYWTQHVTRGNYEGSPVLLYFNVREDVQADHLVILEGNAFTEAFTVRESSLTRTNELDIIESKRPLTGSILALAELVADPPREQYFSTTLSPNARNPENKTIKIFGDGITGDGFRFQVFNRWGLSVFETTSASAMMNEGWDGRHNGNILPSGVYPYSLAYRSTSGIIVNKTGFITIIQ